MGEKYTIYSPEKNKNQCCIIWDQPLHCSELGFQNGNKYFCWFDILTQGKLLIDNIELSRHYSVCFLLGKNPAYIGFCIEKNFSGHVTEKTRDSEIEK